MLKAKVFALPSNSHFRILITSDIHLNIEKIHKLGDWLAQENRSVDFILCCGDMCNFNPSDSHISELVAACEGEMSSIIGALENIVRGFFIFQEITTQGLRCRSRMRDLDSRLTL